MRSCYKMRLNRGLLGLFGFVALYIKIKKKNLADKNGACQNVLNAAAISVVLRLSKDLDTGTPFCKPVILILPLIGKFHLCYFNVLFIVIRLNVVMSRHFINFSNGGSFAIG